MSVQSFQRNGDLEGRFDRVWHGPDPVLAWAQGAVCVFPQDHLDPIWVPERLVRKVQVQTEAEKGVTDMSGILCLFLTHSMEKVMVKVQWGILSAFPKLIPVRHDLDHHRHESSEGVGGSRSPNKA